MLLSLQHQGGLRIRMLEMFAGKLSISVEREAQIGIPGPVTTQRFSRISLKTQFQDSVGELKQQYAVWQTTQIKDANVSHIEIDPIVWCIILSISWANYTIVKLMFNSRKNVPNATYIVQGLNITKHWKMEKSFLVR